MKSWYWHGQGDLRLREHAPRALNVGEIRVSVAYCGICGSDLHEYADGPHSIPVACPHVLSGRRAPLVIGHEFCGTVIEVAADVARRCGSALAIGTRVAIEPLYRCGRCNDCRNGTYQRCDAMGFAGLMGDGGMAEQAVVPAYMAHRLPAAVSFVQAAVAEPAAVALQAVRSSRLRPGETCVVFGLGAIGQLLVMMARQHGAGQVIGVDPQPERRLLALQLGAQQVLDSACGDVAAVVRDCTRGGAAVCFEAAGSQAAVRAALGSLRKGGEMTLVGLLPDLQLNGCDLVDRDLHLRGSVGYCELHPELLQLIADGKVDPSRIVTRIIELDDVLAGGFQRQPGEREPIKVLVRAPDRMHSPQEERHDTAAGPFRESAGDGHGRHLGHRCADRVVFRRAGCPRARTGIGRDD